METTAYDHITETMDVDNAKETEYDAQLFGFSIDDFISGIKCLFEDEVSNLTSSMASSFIKKYPEGDPEIELIKDIRIALIRKYLSRAQEPLDTLKAQLKALMHIPPHVLLPDDAPQRVQYTAEEEQEVDMNLEELFQRLNRAKAFKVELLQELKMLQDIVPDLTKRVKELESVVENQRKKSEVLIENVPAIDNIIESSPLMLKSASK